MEDEPVIEPVEEPEPEPELDEEPEAKLKLDRNTASFMVERIYNICSIYLTVKSDISIMELPTNPNRYIEEILSIFKEFGIIE